MAEMSAEAKRAINAYVRKWRKANPDKVKAYNIRYWEKKAKELEAAQHDNSDR